MRWFEQSWAAWDVESTGFKKSSRIIELGVVTFERGIAVRRWSSLFCPSDVDWNDQDVQGALKVNGITREQLQGQPTFQDMLPQLLVELDAPVWVSHNFSFDERMLLQEFNRCNAKYRAPEFRICTLDLARKYHPTPGNKLAEVAPRFGVTLSGAHRAVADAEACGYILAAMVRGGHVPADDAAMQRLCSEVGHKKR
jgi:DNA polymerase-3 subunit epsilon